MQTFEELYYGLLDSAAKGRPQSGRDKTKNADARHLDCLLHPEKYAPVWRVGDCGGCGDNPPCADACLFDAIGRDENRSAAIDGRLCVGCSACIDACAKKNLTASRDIMPVLEALQNAKGPVYAMIAPAFTGQLGEDATPGKLRSAFKRLGFSGMVEVALFADILTLKEALEFDRNIRSLEDYMLTSCCCPVWIAMIRRIYREFIPHVPGSVSPMVACGRTIKRLEPGAVTVFVGPCIAKKAEARETDIADAVDFVLTFEEARDVFDAFRLDWASLEDDVRDHSSRAGRLYARTGGVSEAVENTVAQLNPGRDIPLRAQQADGVPACRELLGALKEGKITANFLEGMGCVGGCVGGPKALIAHEEGRRHVNRYGGLSELSTPLDNRYVLELLERLGFSSVERLLEDEHIFTRNFQPPQK